MNTKCMICVSMAVVLLMSLSAKAEPILQLGLLELAPLGYENSEKQITGVIPELAEHMMQRTGLQMQMKLLAWARVVDFLSSGEIDIAFGPNTNLPPEVEVITRAFDVRYVVLHRKDTEIQAYDDLQKLKKEIGFMRGGYFFQKLLNDPLIRKREVTSYEQGVLMLGSNRLDGMAISDIAAFALIKKHNLADVIAFPGYIHTKSELSLLISKKSKYYNSNISSQLKQVVDTIREDGIVQQLTDKYIGEGWNK